MALVNYTLSSSAIASIGYDDETEEVFVTFTDGRSYTLQGVPALELFRWLNADSKGTYWNLFMRGRY
jgi:ssDNA-specific exonuclease RecJ